ncbi:MAG: DUF1080 domain-containing protein [Bacteroidetes bacterium]|nr:DUF1080 domain-containing protein [Bacteroidota bacterium]
MKRITVIKPHYFLPLLILLLTAISAVKAKGATNNKPDSISIEGRWDITVDEDGKPVPSWLEVHHSGLHTLVGRFVGGGGSARPIAKVNYDGSKMSFSIPPQWENTSNDLVVEGTVKDINNMSGTMITPYGKTYNWTAVRAPSLKRTKEPVWGAPIKLFNGKDLSGWHITGEKNQWVVENGVLKSPHSGSNLVSDKKFNDFKLHIEFRYPKESNSGVYLRGRYEIQVEDSKGKEASVDYLGAIYGFIIPKEQMAKAAGEWQSYDVTLVGRRVTLIVNGKQVITDQEIPGITGGALDSNEGEPGPLQIQGDHGPVEYRNIIITPAKE